MQVWTCPSRSVLVATGELSPSCTEGLAFCGELGLNGSLRHVPGMIALADAAAPLHLVVPLCDVREAALVRGAEAHGAATLAELVEILRGQRRWPAVPAPRGALGATVAPDLSDVRVRRSAGGRSRSPRPGATTSS